MRALPLRVLVWSSAVFGLLLGATACGGDDDDGADAVDPVGASADSVGDGGETSETSTGTGTEAAGADAGAAPTVDQLMAAAAAAEVDGLEADAPTEAAYGDNVQAAYHGDGVSAFVTVSACDPFLCWDLDGEVGPEHEANLRSALAPVHLENPDLVFEYGNVEPVPGYESFYVYNFSFIVDGTSKSAANSYTSTYHDDSAAITIRVQPEQGFLPETAEEFQAEMDQATGEAIAAKVLAAYTDLFRPTS